MENLVYHYTSLDALLGIIGNTPHKLTFWGSRYDCMNDPQDYLFASKIVLPKFLESLEKREDISDALNENNDFFPYIVSFSEKRDDEFMWKHYNADVCLEIDTKFLSPWIKEKEIIKGFWGQCTYVKEQNINDSFIKSWRNSLQYIENIPSMARHACVYIKRDAFSQEKEWRLYIADECLMRGKANGELYYAEQPQDVKFRFKQKEMVLYKEFKVQAEALKTIIVNDTDLEHFHKLKKHLELLLKSNKLSPMDIQIEQTNRYPF